MRRPHDASTTVSFRVCSQEVKVLSPSAIASTPRAESRCRFIPAAATTAMTETRRVTAAMAPVRSPRRRIVRIATAKLTIATSSSACEKYHLSSMSISYRWATLEPVPLSPGCKAPPATNVTPSSTNEVAASRSGCRTGVEGDVWATCS